MVCLGSKHDAICLFGPYGAGKGYAGRCITGMYKEKAFVYSIGDELRSAMSNGCKELAKYVNQREFVPDEFLFRILEETVSNYINFIMYDPSSQYIVLDGIPRKISHV